MESMNSLAGTLNAEKKTIGNALDATGPAVKVLAEQHDELISMLGSLDKLGRVGTRVINASKGDVLKMLEHLAPVLDKLAGAGDELAPGLNLLASFPFPKAANAIVQGDYADTIARVDIDLANLLRGVGIPDIQLPDLGEVIDQVGKCLTSGKLTSRACSLVLTDLDLLKNLRKECRLDQLKDSPVCAIVNAVPDLRSLVEDGLLGDTLNGLLGGVSGLSRSMQEGDSDPTVTTVGLLGGAA
ncbi:Mce/MlaD family protein [Nocardioides sambongensis]|uniref:hypothetical protein n=1 Tax=Nocardioides sambongensis TaxID=2589074 RepID=UPI00112A60B4|nr:hypothetical protein [Nocardioides sambongensis]